ncbi:MAG: 6,7-dimethyl-8-ribityllumazine synthase [Candidatus Omnitrophica bacterium]|nr:6,7-dimethyl-8-ribityllumazine synthase [Candidatus Omnitrophota bacterium]
MKEIKADLLGKGKRFAIVISRFNEFISSKLLEGAHDTLLRHGVGDNDIVSVWVPGSFEIPAVAQKLARAKKYDGIICLGTVLRGDTPHFDYIASEASKGIAKISLDEGIPCIFGIITADTLEQAVERAGTKSGNKGRDAAMTALELANLYEKI